MHNAAAGMRAEILAGREIPHATVIAFSQGKGGAATKTTTTFAIPDRFIDRSSRSLSLSRPFLLSSVPIEDYTRVSIPLYELLPATRSTGEV